MDNAAKKSNNASCIFRAHLVKCAPSYWTQQTRQTTRSSAWPQFSLLPRPEHSAIGPAGYGALCSNYAGVMEHGTLSIRLMQAIHTTAGQSTINILLALYL